MISCAAVIVQGRRRVRLWRHGPTVVGLTVVSFTVVSLAVRILNRYGLVEVTRGVASASHFEKAVALRDRQLPVPISSAR